jgi:ankyrin repeat protein
VFCQLNTLKLCRKESALKESLEQLPRDLDETYDRILQNIELEDSKEAFAALQWLAYSERPLSLNELAEAVVLGPERCAIHDRDRLLDPYQVLHICSSLVVLVNEDSQSELEEGDYVDESGEEGKFVSFAHFSVKEYITSESMRKGPAARFHVSLADSHAFIAKTCLSYLLNLDSADSWPQGESRTHMLRAYPLVEYAARYWPAHLSTLKGHTDHEDNVTVLASTLLGPESWAFFNWLRIHDPVRSICFSEKGAIDSEEGSTGVWFYDEFYLPPLYYASRLKLPGLAQSLLDKGADVNRIGGDVHTALHAACAADYIMPSHVAGDPSLETMKVLLDRGAEVDIKNDENCTPLYECVFREKWSEARLLVERGANVNLMSDWGCTPLNTAIRRSHEDMVRLLVDKGADVEAVRSVIEGGGTVLHTVLNELDKREEYGLPFDDVYLRITEFLLEHGANVDAEKQNGCTVLHEAARQANEAMVQLLLGQGAAIDAKSGDGQTALQMVAHLWHDLAVEELWIRREHPRSHSVQKRHRQERIAQLLLDCGAEIDAADHRGETALHEAAKCGNKAVVRILVKRGAAIDKINFEGRTALHLAALYGPTEHLESISCSHSASDAGEESSDGRAETIDLLEEKATDAEEELSDDRAEIIELLPNEATDADEESHDTRAARNNILVSMEYAETVELLLEGKVDIEAKDVDGQTAPYLAAKRRHKKIVKMLLERGADIEAKDAHGRTALHLAASEYDTHTTVEVLLKNGADIEAKDADEQTALHLAVLRGHKKTVEVLLANGADRKVKTNCDQTAFDLASLYGREKVKQLLLDERVDGD